MNTETSETPETIEPTSDVITDEGVIITPTRSTTKTDLFDRSVSWVAAVVALLVVVGIGLTLAFSMGFAASQKHEVTSTTYNHAGVCLSVHSLMISGTDSGENPEVFAKYKAAHSNETPDNVGCPIPFENNTKR